jgi:hypothetical protein
VPPAVHAFTTTAKVRRNVLSNECQISRAWDPARGGLEPPLQAFDAIWDTGATNSAISRDVVEQCGLVPTGMTEVSGVHGVETVETYLVNIRLPNGVTVTNTRVTKATLRHADVLIGMDVITMGDFAVTNAGGFTQFSFRMPSQGHIDFVAESKRRRRPLGPPRS